MERRLATYQIQTPASQDVVLPQRSTPSHDIRPIVEMPSGLERIVAYTSPAIEGDRGLERLSASRIAELRMRLETGAYNTREVMTELAMRLLESGEL